MKVFSVFSGAGGFEQGLPPEWELIGQSEIDKYCKMVLRYHYPNVKNYGDINAIRWNEISYFDLLVGGSPCQDVSLAGKRKGLKAERSGLFFAYVKALKEAKPLDEFDDLVEGFNLVLHEKLERLDELSNDIEEAKDTIERARDELDGL